MPSYEQLRIDQLTEDGAEWLRALLAAIESMDVDSYVALMSDDVELVLNNGAITLTGREAVRTALTEGWAPIAAILHHELNVLGTDRNLVHESVVDFTLRDGTRFTQHSTAWIDRGDDGRMAVARIYGDPS